MSKSVKYRVGDIVRLKSGGPSMTVEEIRGDDEQVCCHWFAGDKLHYGVFSPNAIGPEDELNLLTKLGKSGRCKIA